MESRVPARLKDNVPNSIAIVGCGGVGSWVALFFSQFDHVNHMGLFDSDVVELSNLERTVYRKPDLDREKTDALEDILREQSSSDMVISCYDDITEDNYRLLNFYKLRVVCADDVECRNIVMKLDNSISIGYDITPSEDSITVSESGSIWDIDGDDGYTIEPSWSVPAVLPALIAVYSVARGKRPVEVSTNISELFRDDRDDNKESFSIP